jgi:hypothetical protein
LRRVLEIAVKRFLPLTAFLCLALSSFAAPPRRAVARPSARLTSWNVTISDSGGLAPASRTGVTVDSSGAVTLLDSIGHPICSGTLAREEIDQLTALIAQASPSVWIAFYALPGNPDGCCDQIRTDIRLARTVEGQPARSYQTYWFEDHIALPADLNALYARIYGPDSTSLRGRYESQCLSQPQPAVTGWTFTMTEEGGFAYRYQRVTVDSKGSVSVVPNPRTAACSFTLSAAETQQLDALITGARPASWATSYVRPENPNGCCDQIHTTVQLIRKEADATGSSRQTVYTTDWYSDHNPLPSDLNALFDRLFTNGLEPAALFPRFAPQCGPQF